LGNLYKSQGKLGEAEKMYQRALDGYEKALGPEIAASYIPALNTVYNLGLLFASQDDIDRARAMYSRALVGYQKVFGHDHPRCESLRGCLTTLAKTDLSVDTEVDGTHRPPIDVPRSNVQGTKSGSRKHRLLKKLGLR
jgi:tetratricopeptide (TPR) repeat protein